MSLKSNMREIVRLTGLDIVRYQPGRLGDVEARRVKWLADLEITLMLDVGANVGQYARNVRGSGFAGRILSFEPVSRAFDELKKNAHLDPGWQVMKAALGASPGKATINISKNNAESSSLLPMDDRHALAAPQAAYEAQEEVSIIRLDSLKGKGVQLSDVVWLKMDVQGFEFNVLDGATDILPQIAAIEIELSVVSLYRGQPLIEESISRLRDLGFVLCSFEDVFREPGTQNTLQIAGIFKRHDSRK